MRRGLDRRRFPWVSENREATQEEKAAAILASAALIATRRVGTVRRNAGKEEQELLVESTLTAAGLSKRDARPIPTLNHAPHAGEFCRESLLGSRKADLVVRLWDQRIMPIAVLGGVYKGRYLTDAQQRGLTLFWAHDLKALVFWIEKTR